MIFQKVFAKLLARESLDSPQLFIKFYLDTRSSPSTRKVA
jgi:hypothetical protein